MTKQELISRQKAMERSSNRWAALFLAVFFGVLLANLPLSSFMEREDPATWIQVLYGVMFFGILIGNIPLLIWFAKRQQRQFGLLCPSCGKPLVGVTGQVAVATGFCGHCGEKILSDQPLPDN